MRALRQPSSPRCFQSLLPSPTIKRRRSLNVCLEQGRSIAFPPRSERRRWKKNAKERKTTKRLRFFACVFFIESICRFVLSLLLLNSSSTSSAKERARYALLERGVKGKKQNTNLVAARGRAARAAFSSGRIVAAADVIESPAAAAAHSPPPADEPPPPRDEPSSERSCCSRRFMLFSIMENEPSPRKERDKRHLAKESSDGEVRGETLLREARFSLILLVRSLARSLKVLTTRNK